ncbi:MAG: hypothetical protein II272_00970, partial [Oscillospiraceae bacterium]|nr:hypothetical protein [Oscillospiraceae bacterium]
MCRQCVEGCRFVRRIGAMVLWVVFWWNRCGEPSQALRASSPGGRAKGLAGIDRRCDKSRFLKLFEVRTQPLASPFG